MTMKKLIEFSKTDSERYKTIWDLLHDHIDEKDKRLLAAAMAQSLGYGGQKVICELTGVSQATVKYGVAQLTLNFLHFYRLPCFLRIHILNCSGSISKADRISFCFLLSGERS